MDGEKGLSTGRRREIGIGIEIERHRDKDSDSDRDTAIDTERRQTDTQVLEYVCLPFDHL